MTSELPPIALFGYDSSPFTTKIRLTLRLMQIPYTFVLVPSMMPRPILVDNFNLTYRKIPVLAIGKEIIVDTSLIMEWLHSHPYLRAFRDVGREVHHDAKGRALARLLSSYVTDRPLFRLTTGLIPSVVWRTHFGKDRAGLIGHALDADKLEKKVPQNLAGLDTFLSVVEPLFAELGKGNSGWILGDEEPSAADLSFYYQLDWGDKISRGEGINDLTGGEAGNGIGEGMREVFNQKRYPGLWAWFGRFRQYLEALPNQETRIEKGDEQGVEDLMSRLAASARSEEVPLLPTSTQLQTKLEARNGLEVGELVKVMPDDTGFNDPTIGMLLALSPEEVVIEPSSPEAVDKAGRKARVGGLRLHFPRIGFRVVRVKPSKL